MDRHRERIKCLVEKASKVSKRQLFENSILGKIANSYNDPIITWNTTRSKIPIYVPLVPLSPTFNSVSLYGRSLPDYCGSCFHHMLQW